MSISKKVLIVEDEMVVAMDLAQRLRKLGYECSTVPSGDCAATRKSGCSPPAAKSWASRRRSVTSAESGRR